MQKGLYRKLTKHICNGCDHPAYCPSKKINPKRKCIQCRKNMTIRKKNI